MRNNPNHRRESRISTAFYLRQSRVARLLQLLYDGIYLCPDFILNDPHKLLPLLHYFEHMERKLMSMMRKLSGGTRAEIEQMMQREGDDSHAV